MEEYTFLVLGDSEVGKTTLIKRFKNDVKEELVLSPYSQTTSVTEYRAGFETKQLAAAAAVLTAPLQIDLGRGRGGATLVIDAPGCHAVVDEWTGGLRRIDCVVFAFAINNQKSLANLWFWYRVFENIAEPNASEIKRLVIATKCDDSRVIRDDLQKKVNSFKDSIGATFLSTSAYEGKNIKETFNIPQEIKSYDFGESVSTRQVCEMAPQISSTPSEVDTNDYIITDIAFSSGGLIMKSNDTMLIWNFLSQSKIGKMTSEVHDHKAPAFLRNPSCHFLATKSEEKGWWVFQRTSSREIWGIEACFQPQLLKTRCIKDIGVCTRNKELSKHEDKFFAMVELFVNGQMKEHVGTPNKMKVRTDKHNIKSLDITPCYTTAITSRGELLFTDSTKLLEFPLTLMPNVRWKVDRVACGLEFTVILTTQKEVFAWGDNRYGQLGLGDRRARPKLDSRCKVKRLAEETKGTVIDISAGFYHAAALKDTGILREWGLGVKRKDYVNNEYTPLPFSSRGDDRSSTVVSMCCGAFHTLCIGKNNPVFARGKGDYGQLGTGEVLENVPEAKFVGGQLYKCCSVTQVAAGYQHSAFLMSTGEVYTCGSNEYGQLGYLTTNEKNPVVRKVEFREDFRAERIMCREDCTVAVGKQGEVFMWGAASYQGAVQPSFPQVPHQANGPEITDVTLCTIEVGYSNIELTVALTQRKQIAVFQVRDLSTDEVISFNKKPCFFSTNLKCPRSLCFTRGYLVVLDLTGKPFCCNFEAYMVTLAKKSLRTSVKYAVSFKDKKEKTTAEAQLKLKKELDMLSAKTLALSLTGQQLKIVFESMAISCTFKHICTTTNEVFLLSNLGDVYRLDLHKTGRVTSKSSQAEDLKCPTRGPSINNEHSKEINGRPEKCQSEELISYPDFVFHEHFELSYKVVTQMACGPNRAVVLTQDGLIYVFQNSCHSKSDGPLPTEFIRFHKLILVADYLGNKIFKQIVCGERHTAALTDNGRVFVWEHSSDEPRARPPGDEVDSKVRSETSLSTAEQVADPCSCKVTSDIRCATDGTGLALHKPLYKISLELCSQEVHMINKPKVLISKLPTAGNEESKFKVSLWNLNDDVYEGFFGFPTDGSYKIHVIFQGRAVSDSHLKCEVGQSVEVATCKLMLLGPCSRTLSRVLNTTNGTSQRGDIKYEVWNLNNSNDAIMSGEPFSSEDFLSMTCVTNKAIYLYALDASKFTSYSLRRLQIWLHYLAYKAPNSSVAVVGLNEVEGAEELCVNKQNLRKINPNVKEAAVFDSVTQENIFDILDKCNLPAGIIPKGLVDLENKIVKCRSGKPFITEEEFSQLASQCNLSQDWQQIEAAQYLEDVGVALLCGSPEMSLVLDRSEEWFAGVIKLIKNKCPNGILNFPRNDATDVEMKYIVDFLVKKSMAFKSRSSSSVYIPHLFPPLPDSVWPEVKDLSFASCIVVRNLIYNEDPLMLYATFPDLCAKIAEIREDVCFGEFSMIIRIPEEKNIEAKIECGPSYLVDCKKTEFRVTVRALCTEQPPPSLSKYTFLLTNQLRELRPTDDVRVPCTKCYCHYFALDDAKIAITKKDHDASLRCSYCREFVPASALLHGACERKALLPLWKAISSNEQRLQDGLLREILYRQKRHEKRSEELQHEVKELLKEQLTEIRTMFSQLQKFIYDLHETETPTVVQVIPKCDGPLTYFKPKKWRSLKLFLMCEGDSNHKGIHMLKTSCHKGYELPNEILLKAVGYLRIMIKVFVTAIPILARAIPYAGEVLGGVLSSLGVYLDMCLPEDQEKWKDILNKVDDHLVQMQEKEKDRLALPLTEGKPLKIASADYRHLKQFLKTKQSEDNYGGLTKEICDGGRVIWVCAKHRQKRN